jgi:hypothetical protein
LRVRQLGIAGFRSIVDGPKCEIWSKAVLAPLNLEKRWAKVGGMDVQETIRPHVTPFSLFISLLVTLALFGADGK